MVLVAVFAREIESFDFYRIFFSRFDNLEAVNLELVNLNKPISNGHRENGYAHKRKETTQVEIGDPYNEYFVPVNEHKKFMR